MAKQSAVSFEEPASRAVVTLSLGFVDKIAHAHQRLCDRKDDEALHDMRVGMRSLRSTIRAYPEILSFKKSLKKQLKSLASFTNPARDAEVRLVWLNQVSGELSTSTQKLLPELIGYAEQQMQQAYVQVDEHVTPEVKRWLKKLRPAIEACGRAQGDMTFGDCFADRLGCETEELDQRLHAIESEADYHAVHATRIVGKRVRYLLDPLQPDIGAIKLLVKELKKLQDLLGDFHDAQVRLDWLAETTRVMAGAYGASRFQHLVESRGRASSAMVKDVMPVLLALTRLTMKQQQHLFEQILHEQRCGHYQNLISRLRVQAVRSRR